MKLSLLPEFYSKMSKIFLSLLIIFLVAAAFVSATTAYFSDTETSTANTASAGTLNLTVNDHDGTLVENVLLTDLAPGWKGYDGNGVPNSEIKWKLKNTGTVPGNVSVEFSNVHNNDNGCNEPETAGGDNTCGDDQGELGQYLLLSTWKSTSGSSTGSWASGFHNFNQYSTQPWNLNGTVTLGAGESIFVGLKLEIPTSTGNLAQSDSVSFDLLFRLDQTH